MPRLRPRHLLAHAAAALAALMGAAAPADAFVPYVPTGAECHLMRSPAFAPYGQALTDAGGSTIGMGPGSNGGYATLSDGGFGWFVGDTWNGWGQLFVGAAPSAAAAYTSVSPLGCTRSLADRHVTFATVSSGGLQVYRTMLVPAAGLRGVRIVDAVTNTTNAAVTTNVWVGDLLDQHADGLGSDDATTIRATSSGDAAATTADLWAVTTDQGTSSSDPAIAHVWGGPGAAQPISVVRSGAQPADHPVDNPGGTLDRKQFGWGWQQVQLAAHQTARFVSWEIPREAPSRSWEDQAPLAEASATALLAAPLAARYDGMTAAQVATVRNWAPPAAHGTIAAVTGASTAHDTTLRAANVDFGSGELALCTDGDLRWDFGDGGHATGTSVAHRFAAGTASVSLTVAGACGGAHTSTATFAVAGPAPADPLPTPTPTAVVPAPAEDPATANRGPAAAATPAAPELKLYGPPTVKTTTLASSHGLVVGVRANVDGHVRLVLTGTGVKSVQSAVLKANQTAFVKVQLDPSARPAALTLNSIRLRAKLIPSGGGETIENLLLKLRR